MRPYLNNVNVSLICICEGVANGPESKMFRFKLSALLLSLLARLGLAEPNYSILDESSNRWLPDDTLLTGLNTIYNSLSQGLQDNDEKKKRPMSVIAAAMIEYLSSDLTDEQAKLNSALNAMIRNIASKFQNDFDFLINKETNENEAARTDAVRIEDYSDMIIQNDEELNLVKDYVTKVLTDKSDNDIDNNNYEQYYKYDYLSVTDKQIKNKDVGTTSDNFS